MDVFRLIFMQIGLGTSSHGRFSPNFKAKRPWQLFSWTFFVLSLGKPALGPLLIDAFHLILRQFGLGSSSHGRFSPNFKANRPWQLFSWTFSVLSLGKSALAALLMDVFHLILRQIGLGSSPHGRFPSYL